MILRGVWGMQGIDSVAVCLVSLITTWGLFTLYTFDNTSRLFDKQIILVALAGIVMCVSSCINYRFLRHTSVIMLSYAMIIAVLIALASYGSVFSGAQSWFSLGLFAIQPSEFAKIILILVLAKYFSKRHVEIKAVRHIVVSGAYAFVLFVLVAQQPDFGSAIILFLIWFGMALLAGINWKQFLGLVGAGICSIGLMWMFVFSPYQQDRILTYINPGGDLLGTGYNSRQAEIAVGSGGLWGKGIGYGTQSRLSFLPQYETDFVVAAFAEEWGFIGVMTLLLIYLCIIIRIAQAGMYGESNFEMLFAGGVAIYFMSHVVVHTGINIGLLPITGITIPFMSYGGSHLLTESLALGMVFGMRRYRRTSHRQEIQAELVTHA